MGLAHSPKLNGNGLILAFDAANPKSYPGSGNTIYNVSLNRAKGNNGTLTNGVTYNPEGGGSLFFDGTDDIITVTDVVPPVSNTNRTLIVAARCFQGGGSFQQLVSYGSFAGSNANNVYSIGYSASGATFSGYTNTPVYGTLFFANSGITANAPYVLAMRYDDSGAVKNNGFINGRKLTPQTGEDWTNFTGSTTSIRIGSRVDGTGFFKGLIYTIKLYDRALSDDEILQDFYAFRGRFGL